MRYLPFLATAIILSLPAIVSAQAPPPPSQAPQTTAFKHKNFDAEIVWQTARTDGKLTITGSLRNTRFAAMEDIEIAVVVLDQAGNKLASDRQLLIPHSLRNGDAAPFTLQAPLPPGARPEKLRFNYRYRANEGDAERILQMQSFDAPFTGL